MFLKLIFLGLFVYFLTTDTFNDFFSSENINSGQHALANKVDAILNNEVSWWLWVMLGVSVIAGLLLLSGPKRDKRFSTGYEDNAEPLFGFLGYLISFTIFISCFLIFWTNI